MITIHKYQLDVLKVSNQLTMPSGAKILTLKTQYDGNKFIPVMWAMVQKDNPEESRIFELFATGQPVESSVRKSIHYIGSFQIDNMERHVFEVKKS